jgi:F420-non-reducing hydrogenase large subunit
LLYSAFMVEDHNLHFFFLGGPDFVVGPDAPAGERNILGVLAKVGMEIGGKVIAIRRKTRKIIDTLGGKAVHPVCGLPGGVSRGVSEAERQEFIAIGKEAVEFCEFALGIFEQIVLGNAAYVDLITGPAYQHQTYYMGLVDENDKVNFYDGQVKVVTPEGKPFLQFPIKDYLSHIAEHVEPWTYAKFPFLKAVGWNGFVDGPDSGIYAVAPLARLNVASGMATPRAQARYEQLFSVLGGKPSGHTLAFHWARLVEALYAAERLLELAQHPALTSPDLRNMPTHCTGEGIGVIEAPRGTLIHHYQADEQGMITGANLIVATQNNMGRISLSVTRAAQTLLSGGTIDETKMNLVEMAFRAYDPCMACATHSLPGELPLELTVRGQRDGVVRERFRHKG